MAVTDADCYRTLGLHVGASSEVAREAFKRLALERHPDRLCNAHGRDISDFNSIYQAYERIMTMQPMETTAAMAAGVGRRCCNSSDAHEHAETSGVAISSEAKALRLEGVISFCKALLECQCVARQWHRLVNQPHHVLEAVHAHLASEAGGSKGPESQLASQPVAARGTVANGRLQDTLAVVEAATRKDVLDSEVLRALQAIDFPISKRNPIQGGSMCLGATNAWQKSVLGRATTHHEELVRLLCRFARQKNALPDGFLFTSIQVRHEIATDGALATFLFVFTKLICFFTMLGHLFFANS